MPQAEAWGQEEASFEEGTPIQDSADGGSDTDAPVGLELPSFAETSEDIVVTYPDTANNTPVTDEELEYIVEPGDTLSEIAAAVLGSASR